MNEASSSLEQSRNLRARGAAQAAAERLAVTPTGIVRYTSRGRVLTVATGLLLGGPLAIWLMTVRDLDLFVPLFAVAFFFL